MAEKCAYVLVRVPKSGSTSLQSIAAAALPEARVFETPETARTISKGRHPLRTVCAAAGAVGATS